LNRYDYLHAGDDPIAGVKKLNQKNIL